jgi:hypothetical protein
MPHRKGFLSLCLLLLLSSCVSRRVNVPAFIPPVSDASLSDLVAIVNQRRDVRTLTARVDLQFETLEQAEEGRLRRFRSAQGRIILARPQSIRLQIEAPVLGLNLAEMASDGRRFQLLIYPEEYRAFITGSNNREYLERTRQLETDPKLEKAGPLVNIRPQHFTTAFLFEPIDLGDAQRIAVMEEARRLVEDDRPGAKKGQMAIKSYYVLSVIQRGEASPRYQYWFDRSRGLELVGQQTFSQDGSLLGDVTFSNYGPALPMNLPGQIHIVRPYDRYALRITMSPGTVILDRDVPESAFSIDVPPEWGNSVRQIDLDESTP